MASQVEEIGDIGGSKVYRTSCQCYDPCHNITFNVEVDEEIPHEVVLNISVETRHFSEVWSYDWKDKLTAPFRKVVKRTKAAFKILTTGTVTMETGFIFRGEKQIDEFCSTIQNAKLESLVMIEQSKDRLRDE